MKILYGLSDNNIDVTEICLNKLTKNNIIIIPHSDSNRAHFFTDPINGVLKKIIIIDNNNNITEYDDFFTIRINITENTIQTINENDINQKITQIHSTLSINYGSLNEELPEQKMAIKYLQGNEKVLEIGGNIGRNSLVISRILQNPRDLVVLESDADIANQLLENRNTNNLDFIVEQSALSKRKLIQRGWITIESDVLLDGYKNVNTINYEELISKYDIAFDTLVLDCEGAFYYILMDMPEILQNINLIIMENDYNEIKEKEYIDDVLIKNNFYRDYLESGGWGPCCDNFFEVWKKSP
jgi:FkbM family methyltransferase